MNEIGEFNWTSCGMTHVGNVRRVNEDSLLDKPDSHLWVVADGMGGHAAGDVASQKVISELDKMPKIATVAERIHCIEDSLLSSNKQLLDFSRNELNSRTMGSTVVGMIGHKNQCVFFWVGDSRLYRLRDQILSQLSEDHTEISRLVSQGLLTKEEAKTYPENNIITRAVGADVNLLVDFDHVTVEDKDIYLLCSDGLDKELSDDDIETILNKTSDSLDERLHSLMQTTLSRGARDNVTVILVEAKVL